MSTGNLQVIIDRYLSGQSSAPIAIMELLLSTADADAVARVVSESGGAAAPMHELRRLANEHAAGCAKVAGMLRSGLDSMEPAATIDEGIARARRLFDHSVTQSEEASVALYSLGSPALLAAATEEAVSVLADWDVLDESRDALEIGCGIGRFLLPLASRLRSLVGIDVSLKMIEAARRRLGHCPNVHVQQTTGRDLAAFARSAFDLVYSIDTFPYLVISGRALIETHLREVARVLRPGGDLIIFNYAYGRARDADARELGELGAAAGLSIVRCDESPFRLWNGIAFHLRKPAGRV